MSQSPQKTAGVTSRIRNLSARAAPLADWYAKFKPECKTLRVTADEFELLLKHKDKAADHGFTVTAGGKVYFGQGGFEVRT